MQRLSSALCGGNASVFLFSWIQVIFWFGFNAWTCLSCRKTQKIVFIHFFALLQDINKVEDQHECWFLRFKVFVLLIMWYCNYCKYLLFLTFSLWYFLWVFDPCFQSLYHWFNEARLSGSLCFWCWCWLSCFIVMHDADFWIHK